MWEIGSPLSDTNNPGAQSEANSIRACNYPLIGLGLGAWARPKWTARGGRRPIMRAHLVCGVPIGRDTAQSSEEVAQKVYLGPEVTQNAFECSPFCLLVVAQWLYIDDTKTITIHSMPP